MGNEEVSLRYTSTSGATITGTITTYLYGTKDYDTHGAYNPSTGEFKAPMSGKYKISASLGNTYSATAGTLYVRFYVNGVQQSLFYLSMAAGTTNLTRHIDTLNLLSSDIVTIRVDQSPSTSAAQTTAGLNVLTIDRLK